MEPAVAKFLEELVALCRRHNLVITASMYDNLQVWPLEDGVHGLDAITEAEDRTSGTTPKEQQEKDNRAARLGFESQGK